MTHVPATAVRHSLDALHACAVQPRLLRVTTEGRREARRLHRLFAAAIHEGTAERLDVLGWSYPVDLSPEDRIFIAQCLNLYRHSCLYTSSEVHNRVLEAERFFAPFDCHLPVGRWVAPINARNN